MNTVGTTTPRSERFLHLVGDIRADIKNLIKKEIGLAKAEMGEKFHLVTRNAVFLAAGGVIGLMAMLILFLTAGALVALGLLSAGFSMWAAVFAAYGGLGLLLGLASWLLVQKALHAFTHLSLAPEKALETVRTSEAVQKSELKKIEVEHPRQSSDELKTEVEITRARMDAEMHELRQRLTPGYIARSTVAGVKHHPLRTLLITAGTGLGSYLLWKRNHHPVPPPLVRIPRCSPAYWLGRIKASRA